MRLPSGPYQSLETNKVTKKEKEVEMIRDEKKK